MVSWLPCVSDTSNIEELFFKRLKLGFCLIFCPPWKCSTTFLPEKRSAHTLADISNRRIRQINHEFFYLNCAVNKCSRLESSFRKNPEFLLPSRNIVYSTSYTVCACLCPLHGLSGPNCNTATSVNQSSQCSQRILVQGQLEHVL